MSNGSSHARGLILTTAILAIALAACSGGPSFRANGPVAPPGGQHGGGSTDPTDLIVGVWNGAHVDSRFGRVQEQWVFQSDGSYSWFTSYLDAGSRVLIKGSYDLHATDGILHAKIEHAEPKQYCGPLGCNDIHYPDTEDFRFTFADGNTLQLADILCGSACQTTFSRAV